MENPLSQSEIDALMRTLLPSTSEDIFQTRTASVRVYDFRRPGKFSKDLLRTLFMVHDTFARLLQGFFAAALRTRVQVSVRSTNQYSSSEYTQLLPNPCVVAKFEIRPLPGTCFIEMSHNIAFAIVDRVFGGHGSEVQPQRGLSEIELSVIQRMTADLFTPLREAWRNVAEIQPTLDSMETNPMFLQNSAAAEVVAVITLGIDIGEHKGHISLSFPYATVEPVLARLSPQTWLASDRPETEEEERQVIQKSVGDAPLGMRAILGKSNIKVQEFVELKAGDVLLLGTKVNGDVQVFVGDRLLFLGRPGLMGDKMSVQITRHAVERPKE
ncbi:MAG TPA: flagellar motor switch protein FliM [Symbiobacteriaceae bacterium]|jgi:flagellar motor switch protein FliM